jgi:uncharacterized protein (TIGR00255 family)
MIKSMTGYGKSECTVNGQKLVIEIRSVNGKSADISLKSQIIPKETETAIRSLIAEKLYRGNIDLFVTADNSASPDTKEINGDVLAAYWGQLQKLSTREDLSGLFGRQDTGEMLQALLKMPDVIEVKKFEPDDEGKQQLIACISQAADRLDEYRTAEGASIERDFSTRVSNILGFVDEIEKHEQERISAIRERIVSKLADLPVDYDRNRLEQELIYYIEKLDINEEKVRLRQHCKYFIETFNEENPGKKLAFIAQEMGREINTLGSKANHAEIQKTVVRMKDELEKIKEQTLNTL